MDLMTIKRYDGLLREWIEIDGCELSKGDMFRMYYDGEMYVNPEDGSDAWIVTCDKFSFTKHDNLTVSVENAFDKER